MRFGLLVAARALHTGGKLVGVQDAAGKRSRGMTIEAFFRALLRQLAADRFIQAGRNFGTRTDSEIETVGIFVEAHAALVPATVAIQQVRLAGRAESEGPRDGNGKLFGSGPGSRRYAVNALVTLAFDCVGERALVKSEFGVRAEDRRGGRALQSVRHARGWLRCRLLTMTIGALGRMLTARRADGDTKRDQDGEARSNAPHCVPRGPSAAGTPGARGRRLLCGPAWHRAKPAQYAAADDSGRWTGLFRVPAHPPEYRLVRRASGRGAHGTTDRREESLPNAGHTAIRQQRLHAAGIRQPEWPTLRDARDRSEERRVGKECRS